MVKRVILEDGPRGFTNMKEVFNAIEDMQINYNFLITDFEGYPESKEVEERLNRNYIWINGKELTKIVTEDDFQWVWGLLSAFPKKISIEEALKYPLPSTEENEKIWGLVPTIQNPLAEFEILAFDSSLVMITSKNNKIIEIFKKNETLAKDL